MTAIHYYDPAVFPGWPCGRVRPTSTRYPDLALHRETARLADVTCRVCRGSPEVWDRLVSLLVTEVASIRRDLDKLKAQIGTP
jgi:hypothetical protein